MQTDPQTMSIHTGGSRNLRMGGSFNRVRAERGEKFWVTTPTLPNHAHFN